MNRLTLVALGLVFIGFILGAVFGKPAFAQQKVDQLPVGRYQIATSRSTNNNLIYVMDTATGKTWCFGENFVENEEIVQKWVNYGSPTDIKK